MDGAWLADPAQSTWTPGSGPDVYGAEQIVKFFDGKIVFSDNPELVNGREGKDKDLALQLGAIDQKKY